MMNTKLSDFSDEALSVGALAFIRLQNELRNHIDSVTNYPSLVKMYENDIAHWQKEIDILETMLIQFCGARAQMQNERNVASN